MAESGENGRESGRESDEFERLRPAGADESAEMGRAPRLAERIEEGAVELRPRGVGQVLDLGLDLARSRFGLCVALGVLVWMPIQWIVVLLPQPDATSISEDIGGSLLRLFWQLSWTYLAITVGDVLVVAIVARIVGDAIEGRRTSAGRAVRSALARLPGLLALGLLMYVGYGLLCFLCVPGLLFLWILTPAPYVYVIEGVGLRTAVRRSVRLSKGELFSWPSFYAFWRWFGILAVGAVLVLPFTLLLYESAQPDVRAHMMEKLHMSGLAFDALRVVIGALFLAAATTVRAGYLTAYYLDCRVRREGLDLETWLGRIRPAPTGDMPA